jgi:ATP synthase I chain
MADAPAEKRPDPRLRAVFLVTGVTAALFAVGALATSGVRAAFSVAAGGAIAAANLYVMIRLVRGATSRSAEDGDAGGARAALGFATVLKMVALYGGVYLLAASGTVGVLPLMVGLGALPIGIASAALVRDRAA